MGRKTPAELDREDPLGGVRELFRLPEGCIYLDGNSLGALPRATEDAVRRTLVEEWGSGLVGSWNEAGWYELPRVLGDRVGELLGAAPGQVAVGDTTTINLYKALSSALSLREGRSKIVMDGGDFPANLYVAEGALQGRSVERRLLRPGEHLADVLDPSVAAVVLSHVNYRDGSLHDLPGATRAAHEVGALAVWDLCHSAGVRPIGLDAAGVDYAVGCGYKFLNGGPGAPAWIYVAARHLASGATQPLSGWMGHADPFEFAADYRPSSGVRRFLCGTPHILSMRALEAGLAVFREADLGAVRRKAESLTGLFIEEVEAGLPEGTIELASPRSPARRGAQVSFRYEHAYSTVQALIDQNVVGDYREPEIMRFGFSPLYLSHEEVAVAARALVRCITTRSWDEDRFTRRGLVT